MNGVVGRTLRSPLHPVFSRSVLILTMRGRKSGRELAFPVSYAKDGDVILLGCDFTWWHNLNPEAPVELYIQGVTHKAVARILSPDTPDYEQRWRVLRPRTYNRALRTRAVLIECILD